MNIQPVILSGGAGTRLWPLSRENYPKQLLALLGEQSLLQRTVTRLAGLDDQNHKLADLIVVCNEEHRFLALEQLKMLGHHSAQIILEPEGRNTAPALTLAALNIVKSIKSEDAAKTIMLVMPADHVINDILTFQAAVKRGAQLAEQGTLVTFGIVPNSPHTGYGYLQLGDSITEQPAYHLKRFVEKPNLAAAQEYVLAGNYLWNSGIFMMDPVIWLKLLENFEPDMTKVCRAAFDAGHQDHSFYLVDKNIFANCPSNSIDYAVMERVTADKKHNLAAAAVIPLDVGWSDVGAWPALWEISPKNAVGNVVRGDVINLDTKDSLILAEHRLVATVGVDDLIVVETADAVLVANKNRAQAVKDVVSQLKAANRIERIDHRRVYRPWGSYESVDQGERFQVKRIVVNPGAKLSLQMHYHRAEHWVVVKGTAKVTQGDQTFILTENQSTYIPLGVRHRLENPGKLPLEIIEVQSGSYLGEDDIVRFDDSYGRNN